MILAFSHPGIVVYDLEAAREFYEKMFGFQVISQEGWSAASQVAQAALQMKAGRMALDEAGMDLKSTGWALVPD